MSAATIPATTTTANDALRVASDFADYLQRHVGEIEQLSARQRRRLRQMIAGALR